MEKTDRMVMIADFRLAALSATDRLQAEIKFGNEWRVLVENTIFDLMKNAKERADAISR